MQTIWWAITLLLMAIGLVGTVLPLLPGTTIILAAAVIHHLMLGAAHSVGWWTIAMLAALTLLSFAVELLSGSIGAKWFGATKWGAIGGILGGIVGLFFGLIGIFVGPLIGVLVGELLGGKSLLPAGKSTWGTLIGTTAGMLAKVGIGIAMIALFLTAALWQ